MAQSILSESPARTVELAASLAPYLQAGDALVLSGDLGTGKTWFANALLAALGLEGSGQSPTFTLVNVYHLPQGQVYHADFYRLDSEAELWAAGWEDYLDGQALLLIEWGERFPAALPLDYLQIRLERAGATEREITVQACGPRSRALMEAWFDALDRD
ncbi:MAG: tRNA (adenosine(37)-N6)-threonylcarbamoyltransferase complex ATPase subunit type 1 TsaE [Bacillota bacterium]|jgi:tRNA threonylcarbamoyladenosine biosynthesis protein TsaE